jgi:hypothetical protein
MCACNRWEGVVNHAFDSDQLAKDVETGADITDILDAAGDIDALDSGEKRLMYAALEDAVLKFFRGIRRPRSVRPTEMRELREWFASNTMTVFSFVTICDVLDINVGTIRKALSQYEAKPFPLRVTAR